MTAANYGMWRKKGVRDHFAARGGPAFLVFASLSTFFDGMSELGATSSEERGPVEVLLRRKAETDRVRKGISEGCRSAEPERVAPGGGKRLSSDIPPRSPRR